MNLGEYLIVCFWFSLRFHSPLGGLEFAPGVSNPPTGGWDQLLGPLGIPNMAGSFF